MEHRDPYPCSRHCPCSLPVWSSRDPPTGCAITPVPKVFMVCDRSSPICFFPVHRPGKPCLLSQAGGIWTPADSCIRQGASQQLLPLALLIRTYPCEGPGDIRRREWEPRSGQRPPWGVGRPFWVTHPARCGGPVRVPHPVHSSRGISFRAGAGPPFLPTRYGPRAYGCSCLCLGGGHRYRTGGGYRCFPRRIVYIPHSLCRGVVYFPALYLPCQRLSHGPCPWHRKEFPWFPTGLPSG